MIHAGYYKIIDKVPSPVVPLFRDGDQGPYYFQIVSHDHKVISFAELLDFDTDRLVFGGQSNTSPLTQGDEAIYAFLSSERHIFSGTLEQFRDRSSAIAEIAKLDENPFVGLDFALFIDDAALIQSTSVACYRQLSSISTKLADDWLRHAPVSEKTKLTLQESLELEGNDAGLAEATGTIHFEASKLMVRLLTTFAESKRTNRTKLLHQLTTRTSIAAFRADLTIAKSVLHTIAAREDLYAPDRVWLLSYPLSNGRARIQYDLVGPLQSAVEAVRPRLLTDNDLELERGLEIFQSGRPGGVCLFFLQLIASRYPEFLEHIHRVTFEHLFSQWDKEAAKTHSQSATRRLSVARKRSGTLRSQDRG